MKNAQLNFAAESGTPGPGFKILQGFATQSNPPSGVDALKAFVSLDRGQVVTDSLKVAQVHGKRHDNVVQLIRQRMAEAGEWGLLNFKETPYTDPQNGRTYPMFVMTKDGYQFLVGKMTGAKAVKHQIAFIEAFNTLANCLTQFLNTREEAREQLAIRSAVSKDKGSFGSGLMHQRRREKHLIEAEIQRLNQPIQMDLLALWEVQA